MQLSCVLYIPAVTGTNSQWAFEGKTFFEKTRKGSSSVDHLFTGKLNNCCFFTFRRQHALEKTRSCAVQWSEK
jgi:hypothetical protein